MSAVVVVAAEVTREKIKEVDLYYFSGFPYFSVFFFRECSRGLDHHDRRRRSSHSS